MEILHPCSFISFISLKSFFSPFLATLQTEFFPTSLKKALDANKLLCDNNTVKTHQVNRSDLKKKLGFVDKIFSKKQFFVFFNKVCKDVKANKERWTSPITIKASDAIEFLWDNQSNHAEPHVFFNFKEWFIYDRECLIYDKIWYEYHAIFSALEGPFNLDIDFNNWAAVFLQFSYFSQNPNTLLCNRLLALLWILVSFWLDTYRICTVKAFRKCLPFTDIARY